MKGKEKFLVMLCTDKNSILKNDRTERNVLLVPTNQLSCEFMFARIGNFRLN